MSAVLPDYRLTSHNPGGRLHACAGLQLYREQQWLPAVVKFQAALDAGDRAAGIMIRRCNRFLKHPPPAGWKGCWDFSDKPQPDAPPGASDRPAS